MDGSHEVAPELPAKRLDVGIHRAGAGCIHPIPHVFEELFAREHRLGWDVWGNEVTSTVQMEQPAACHHPVSVEPFVSMTAAGTSRLRTAVTGSAWPVS